mgnify:CR=1 FL=1
MARQIRIVVPDEIYVRIKSICEKYNISSQDLILRALVKILEEFEVKKR